MKNSSGWHFAIELAVVIAGVLIAFMLNNWHTNLRNSRVEKQYLLSLQNDLRHDHAQIDSLIQFSRKKMRNLNRLVYFLVPQRVRQDSTLIYFSAILQLNKFDAHRATFEALKNTGDFNLIPSYPLQKKIVDYYQTLSAKKHFDDILDSYFQTYIIPLAFREVDFKTGRFLHTKTLLKPYSINLILGYKGLLEQSLVFYIKLQKKCTSLLDNLERTP